MPTESLDLASLVGRSFIQRLDAVAIARRQGGYKPHRTPVTSAQWRDGDKGDLIPWTKALLQEHLDGRESLGHYVLDLDSKCRILAFDVDLDEDFIFEGRPYKVKETFGTEHPAAVAMNIAVRSVADVLAWTLKRRYPQLRVCCSFSGSKGIHVYGLFSEPISGMTAKGMALDVLKSKPLLFERGKSAKRAEPVGGSDIFWRPTREDSSITIEVFPKQEEVSEGGFGNLLLLPLGINKKTNKMKFFYDPHTEADTLTPIDPEWAITEGFEI